MVEIARDLPVHENTLWKWKLKEGWARGAGQNTRKGVPRDRSIPSDPETRDDSDDGTRADPFIYDDPDMVEILRDRLRCKIVELEGHMSAADVDEIFKITTNIERVARLNGDIRIPAVTVMRSYGNYLRERLPEDEFSRHRELILGYFEHLEGQE